MTFNFIGPRPDVLGYADNLHGDDRAVLKLIPGITGLASLKYRDEEEQIATFVEEVKNANSEVRKKYFAIDFSTMNDSEIAL